MLPVNGKHIKKSSIVRKSIAILTILFLSTNLFSQTMTVEQIEIDLHNTYSKLVSYRFGDSIEWDSIEKENKIFNKKIRMYTSTYLQTLTFKFDSLLKDNIYIVSSEDRFLRIFSWDTWMGGTMHYFNNIFQYKSDENVLSKFCDSDSDGPSCFYSQLFTLKAKGKIYYIAISNTIGSTKDASQSIKILTIENQLLNDTAKIIKTNNGYVNSIDVYFDSYSVIDRPERPVRLIEYDSDNEIIYIPIVNEDGSVTDKYNLYEFTGQYFEHIASQKSKQNE